MPGPRSCRRSPARSKVSPRMGFKGPFAVADGRVIHDAGGSEVQELAFVLAAGVAYLRALEGAGVALEDAQGMVYARLSRRCRSVPDLAKFRALRLLWARIEQACGLAPKPLFIAADTAWRMLTQRDPYVNMLRATMATFSAGLGGANAITVLPHTLALGLPDPFARRVARNTQLVLLEESNLAKVSDPAAGSGGIEALTQQLCEAAWSLFQEIEKAGGVFAALEQNLIQRKVAATRAVREAEYRPAQGSADRRHRISQSARGPRRGAGCKAGGARALWRGQIQIRRAAADAAGRAVRSLARPLGSNPESAAARGQRFFSPISARLPTSPRARPLPRAFSRPAASRRSIPKDLPIRRRSPPRSRPPARRWPACARPTRSMPDRQPRRQRPFKPPAQDISIWQAGPASRKPRSAPPASTILSLPAAMRWRRCRRPIG